MDIKLSTARNHMVFMRATSDHLTGKTGLTLTITASKNGGAFASITPTVTERGNGWYSLALTTSHTDTLGDLALHITGADADPTDEVLQVVTDLPGIAQTGDSYAPIAALSVVPAGSLATRFVEADGFEQITSLGTVKTLTVPTGARGAILSATTQNVRFRADGTNPTASIGNLLIAGSNPFVIMGHSTAEGQEVLEQLKFIEVTGSAVLNVSYFY